MCGLAGIFGYRDRAPRVDRVEIDRMREAMAARGPDGAGTWLSDDGRVGLAHRRLAIIDPGLGGAQPMRDGAGRTIVFNGEVYNYRELRNELERDGHRFRSQSDTEVLLAMWATQGEDGIARCRGMFAFAIWDAPARRLVMARDPYGIKPLYWHDDGATVRIASQVRALAAGGQIGIDPDPVAEASYYLWGFIPEPRSVLRGVQALPAGSVMAVDASGVGEPRRFASVAGVFADAARRGDGFAPGPAAVHAALADSVAQHMIADVPVGVFLSAGIDSAVVLALATRASTGPLHAVTLGFDEFVGTSDDEVPLARIAATKYGAVHHVVTTRRNDFERDFDAIIGAMDQPSSNGINSYYVAKAAANVGLKACLSGLGGDEMFGGYPTAQDIPRWRTLGSLLRWPAVGEAARAAMAAACAIPGVRRRLHSKVANAPRYLADIDALYYLKRGYFFPDELARVMARDRLEEAAEACDPVATVKSEVPHIDDDWARIAAQESTVYMRNQLLRDLDWAGGAHGLEVRVPLADAELLRRVAPALARRTGLGKAWLASSVPDLPEPIRRKPKTGFHIPVDRWAAALGLASGLRSRFGGAKDWMQIVWHHWLASLR